ncbi:MAG: 16S rRNA (guanine(527)-N(7))-methyltransferase RsmG [Planctomycetota bacterium]
MLAAGIDRMQLDVPASAVTMLGAHYALLVHWAKRINLTTVVDPDEAAIKHALDCLLFAQWIGEDAVEAVDVGSGGGFPGIVIAVVRPALRLTLLEPIRKRASFLRVATAELALPHVRVAEGKLLEGAQGRPWPVDLVVSRATIPPLALVKVAAPVLRAKGRLILTGGRSMPSVAEIGAVAAASGLEHRDRHGYELPDGSRRWLDELRRPGDAP